VEARVEAMLEAVDSEPPERTRPCDIQKLITALKLRKACGIVVNPHDCLRHISRRPLVYLTHLITHYIRLSDFPTFWKKQKC
jgi:hypothetical protein